MFGQIKFNCHCERWAMLRIAMRSNLTNKRLPRRKESAYGSQ